MSAPFALSEQKLAEHHKEISFISVSADRGFCTVVGETREACAGLHRRNLPQRLHAM